MAAMANIGMPIVGKSANCNTLTAHGQGFQNTAICSRRLLGALMLVFIRFEKLVHPRSAQ